MKPSQSEIERLTEKRSPSPFRGAVVRGLAILMPPLLTIVIFLWVGNTVVIHLLEPMESLARRVMVEEFADIRTAEYMDGKADANGVAHHGTKAYKQVDAGRFIPLDVYQDVVDKLGGNQMPAAAKQIYERYYDQTWLRHEFVVPIFLCLFVLVLYLLGKFLAAGIGRFFWNQMERLIHRVPLVRNVYGSVKQVTDFFFTQPDIQYTRVVAVEYPRKGVWQLAFVTGEGMRDIQNTLHEPVLSVFVPHSPVPFTGFSATIKKSETIDLNITVDQAIQFIVSCGVVIPPQQLEGTDAADGKSDKKSLALSVPVGRDE